jgi:hypothetical protein
MTAEQQPKPTGKQWLYNQLQQTQSALAQAHATVADLLDETTSHIQARDARIADLEKEIARLLGREGDT